MCEALEVGELLPLLLLQQSQTWINLFQQSLAATFSQRPVLQYLQPMVEVTDHQLACFYFSLTEHDYEYFLPSFISGMQTLTWS